MDHLQEQQDSMPPELLLQFREKIRNNAKVHRDESRANTTDRRRLGLGEIKSKIEELQNLTEKDVSGLALRIKRRKHATVEDMYRLSHAFLQNIENIRTFAKIPGAIQVIVKELTGNASDREVSAADCLCNLSLGEAVVCEKIASLAGSYLITYLDSNEERLKRTSLWTLANLIATSKKAAQTLIQMETFPKLWQLYLPRSPTNRGDDKVDYCEEAGICIQLISQQSQELLRSSDMETIFNDMILKDPSSSAAEYHLQIINNCDIVKPGRILNEQQILYLLNFALSNISSSKDFSSNVNRLRIVFAIRVLANLLASQPQAYKLLAQLMPSVWHTDIVDIFKKIFEYRNESLSIQALWLINNIIQKQQEEEKDENNAKNIDILAKLNVYYNVYVRGQTERHNNDSDDLNQMLD